MDRNELLAEAYRHLEWALLSKGKLEVNRSIRRKMKYLTELYGISSEDLLHDIFENFVAKKHYEKFNSAKGKLSTFMTHYARLSLLNILKKQKRLNSNNKKVSLPDDYEDTFDQDKRYSLSYLEKIDFSDGLVERKTPEDLYIKKEQIEKIKKALGEEDYEVLIGLKTRQGEARRKGIDYDTYRKRLYRRILDFQGELDTDD